jgi:arylsulfatase A-like enzyme
MTRHLWAICGALGLAALSATPVGAAPARPNIVHIFADDLGWGSVGFNGQAQIATPNLDALAAAGMRLTNAYSAPVCAPSRAMLYTGFHQGHASIDGNDAIDEGFRAQDVLTPQVIGPTGYTSAVFGKWGFGATGVRNLGSSDPAPTITTPASLPGNHGFSTFYGYLNHGAAQDYFYEWMWQNQIGAPNGVATVANHGGLGGTPQYTHDLFAAQSEQFVTAHTADANPFYMQVNYTIPHFDLSQIATAPGGYGQYASMPWTAQQKAYAAMITRMDATIGALMARLDDPNNDGNHADSIASDTLVIFTSDNGPSFDDAPVDFFDANGVHRGGKFDLFEGGIHAPAIAFWPGTIAPGSVSNYRTDLADFMATAADLAGAETPVGVDGTSIVPTLTGMGIQRQRDYLVFEHQGSHGDDPDPRIGRWAVIRQDGMKLIHYDRNTIEDLFDLNTDPDENSPLNLGIPANAAIVNELRAAAIAEGVVRGVVEYRTYTGPNGGNVQDDSSWDGLGRPHGYWSASIVDAGTTPRIAHVSDNVTTLGIEVRGTSTLQVVDVHAGSTLTGRNEVRIGNHGRVDISGGTLATNRWVNVRAGGELRGQGSIAGDVYNEGTIAPGRPNDAPAWPTAAPPALPPNSLDTGVVTAATFNFAGVQDDVPLVATSVESPYVEVTRGLDFGPGVGPRLGNGGTDIGNEFNVVGHEASSLANAITAGDYLSFSVDPIAGTGIVPSSISFRVWRNGDAAGNNFAILSSVGGFTAGAALVTQSIGTTGSGNQVMLTASIPAVEAITGPIEYRLYGWGATSPSGNTHVNLASLNARFVAVPTLEFSFAGTQNGAPLTAFKRQDANLALTSGLTFGPGVSPLSATDEFHVAGFSTGTNAQSAIDGGDYLSFSVQAVQGLAMYPDSVSFTIWRQGSGSATDYAVYSSVGGFASGQQIAQTHLTTVGAANQLVLSGTFSGAQPTTAPVEFRLYGWNAATIDSTHVVGASMRARFASVVGSPIDPTDSLTVQGDLYHLDGGKIDIDLGGQAAGVDYDALNVVGKVVLEGDLAVSLDAAGRSPFAPALGNCFNILSATQGITGQFGQIALPMLSEELDWTVDYLPNLVRLIVSSSADFNRDGAVDATDLSLWRTNYGKASGAIKLNGDANNDGAVNGIDLLMWQRQFGTIVPGGLTAATGTVPEPMSAIIFAVAAIFIAWVPSARSESIAVSLCERNTQRVLCNLSSR